MSEVKAAAPGPKRFVNVDAEGQVTSRRVHKFEDCSMMDNDGDSRMTNLTDNEQRLLGLSECKVCLKRAEGGPALQAMVEIVGQLDPTEGDLNTEGMARLVLDELKKRGFYLSQRQPKVES